MNLYITDVLDPGCLLLHLRMRVPWQSPKLLFQRYQENYSSPKLSIRHLQLQHNILQPVEVVTSANTSRTQVASFTNPSTLSSNDNVYYFISA